MTGSFGLLLFPGRLRLCWVSFVIQVVSNVPGPRGFLSPQRDNTRERKKWQEKTSGSGQYESHYHATIDVNQLNTTRSINKRPITTHL